MRTWSREVYGLPPHRVIGSIGATEFKLRENGPELLKGADLQILNDGAQKPVSIHTHVGQRPSSPLGTPTVICRCCSGPPRAHTGPWSSPFITPTTNESMPTIRILSWGAGRDNSWQRRRSVTGQSSTWRPTG